MSTWALFTWFTRSVDVKKYDYNTVLGVTTAAPRFVASDCPPTTAVVGEAPQQDLGNNTNLLDERQSCSSISSTSSSDVSSEDDVEDVADGNVLLQENYQPFLGDPLDLRTEDILSKSF